MSALTSRLTSLSSKDAALIVSIDGVPMDITADLTGSAPAAPQLDGRGLLVSVEESRTILDRQQRMQVGGGATINVQDREGLLRSLFAVRSFRSAHITAAVSRTATTLPLNDTTPLPSSGVVYIGSETVQYTGKTSTTLTGCTRGAWGSKAQPHRGGAQTGNGVYLVPPSWLGRRVRLSVVFADDDGARDASFGIEALATFRLEAGPIDKGRGRWELRCSHLSDEVARRKLGTGLADVDGTEFAVQTVTTGIGADALAVTLPKDTILPTSSFIPTQLIMRTNAGGASAAIDGVVFDGEGAYVHDILEVGALPGGQVVAMVSPVSQSDERVGLGYLVGSLGGRPTTDKARQICILNYSTPPLMMLAALTSRIGDGANGIYDVLPGVEATVEGGNTRRFGAGIDANEIDVGSVLAAVPRMPWSWVIDEEVPVGDLLRDFTRATDTAAVFTAAGELSFVPLLDVRVSASATINEADVVGDIVTTVDEGAIYSRVRVECNYDPVDGESEASVDVIDEEIAATYGDTENTLVVESRDIVVTPVASTGDGTLLRPAVSPDTMLPALRRTMLDGRGGALLLTLTASARHLDRQLGDFVALSMPSVSDYRGGTLEAAQGRIVERQPNWQDMTIDLTVLVSERLFHFAPFAVVVSEVSKTVTLSTTTFGVSSPTDPANSFRVGDLLRVYDPIANITVGLGLEVTSIPTSDTLVVNDLGSSIPLTAGWVLMLATSSGGASADGFSPDDYTYNDGGIIPSRWR